MLETAPPPEPAREPAGKAAEIELEQRHVDAAYQRLERMRVEAGDLLREAYRDSQIGTFAARVTRDVKVHQAQQWVQALDLAHNELVFGRLDLHIGEVRRIGRIGVRTAERDPLVIDWRAPAAEPFYRASPEDPMDVVRRRVIHCRGETVVDIEDDLLDPEHAPPGMAIVGDGAFIAALSRTRDGRMHDVIATIQREQDEVIRAPVDATVIVRGGPGTGKTAVALHRVAWLLFRHRQRFGSRGVLVVGPNRRFTAYIERVLPALGEGGASLRSLGDFADGVSASAHELPELARIKGSGRMAQVMRRAVVAAPPDAPNRLRLVYKGDVVFIDAARLDGLRHGLLRGTRRPNAVRREAFNSLVNAAWTQYLRITGQADDEEAKATFGEELRDRDEIAEFFDAWWPARKPLDVLRSLGDADRLRRAARRTLRPPEIELLAKSWAAKKALTYSDVALLDEIDALLGVPPRPPRPRDEDPEDYGVAEVTTYLDRMTASRRAPALEDDEPREYGHIVIDEAQDLSPMQWRMLGRRGRHATWTVVADAAQSSWEDPTEAADAMNAALGSRRRLEFTLTTNYRNSVEIAELAAGILRQMLPDAAPPRAVRSTGRPPEERRAADLGATVRAAASDLAGEVEGTIGVIVPMHRTPEAAGWVGGLPERVQALGSLEAKGLEFDAVVLADPDGIAAEAPTGLRALYVAVTRATQLLTIIRPE